MAKFKKGQSGNPYGKKPGTHNKRTVLAKFLEPHAENLINKAVELALEGDVNALKLCVDRLLPRITSQPVEFDMSEFDIENIDNLSVIGKKIISAIYIGSISPEEGQRLMNILDNQRKLIEHVDMSRKLDEISEHYQLS